MIKKAKVNNAMNRAWGMIVKNAPPVPGQQPQQPPAPAGGAPAPGAPAPGAPAPGAPAPGAPAPAAGQPCKVCGK